MKSLQRILIAVFGIFLGICIMYLFFNNIVNSNKDHIKDLASFEKIQRDTVFLSIPSKPLVIEKAKTKIVVRRDTIIESKPFFARIDTVLQHDTVYAEYAFPENEISILVKRKPDSLELRQTTVFKTIGKEQKWWETPAMLLGGAAFGFLLGAATK